MVSPGTLFIGDNGAFLCIPLKRSQIRALRALSRCTAAHPLHARFAKRSRDSKPETTYPGVITQCAAAGLTVQPEALELVWTRFLWRCPYLERAQGVLGGVRRGPVGPPGAP
jgi:hypothetical protein